MSINRNVMMEQRIPCISFINRYFDFDISAGKSAKTCICTDSPEKPSAKAVMTYFTYGLDITRSADMLLAFVISRKLEAIARIRGFFVISVSNPMTDEKKTI